MALTEHEDIVRLRWKLAEYAIPEQDWNGLMLYLARGIETGSFLRAVLENDLTEAVGYADDDNRLKLADLVVVLHSTLPSESWGSKDKVAAWIERGGLKGRNAAETDAKGDA